MVPPLCILYSPPLAAHRTSFDRLFRDKDFEMNNQLFEDLTTLGKLKGVKENNKTTNTNKQIRRS